MNRILLILCTILSLVIFGNCKDKKKENKGLQAGVVTFSKGDNQLISKDGKEKKIQKDMFFFKEDIIKTGKDGIVDIELAAGISLRVKQNSELNLKEILLDGGSINTKLELKSGKAFIKTNKKLDAKSSLVVITPTYIAGVRGTEFLVEESEGKEQTLVSDGSVSIETLDEKGNPSGKELIIEKGKKGLVENDSVQSSDMTVDELNELKSDSQSITSLTEDARSQIQTILRGVEDQKEINRETLEEQLQKNQTELNDLKDKNKDLLDTQKESDRQLLEETTGKATEQKNEIKNNTNAATDDTKSKAANELEEMRNKNKFDKSQVAPK